SGNSTNETWTQDQSSSHEHEEQGKLTVSLVDTIWYGIVHTDVTASEYSLSSVSESGNEISQQSSSNGFSLTSSSETEVQTNQTLTLCTTALSSESSTESSTDNGISGQSSTTGQTVAQTLETQTKTNSPLTVSVVESGTETATAQETDNSITGDSSSTETDTG